MSRPAPGGAVPNAPRPCRTCGNPAHFNRITQGYLHDDLDDEFDGPHGWHPVDEPGTLDSSQDMT